MRCLSFGTRRGLTIVEVAIGLVVLMILIFGFLAASSSSTRLAEQSRQYEVACGALRDTLELLRSLPPDSAAVAFADLRAELPELRNGQLALRWLSESEAAAQLGFSVDLDLDGAVDEQEASHAGMLVQAVLLRVTWTSGQGEPVELSQDTLLYPRVGEDLP